MLGIILLFQLIVKSVIARFNLREVHLNYSVGWLNVLSIVYFGFLGLLFEWQSFHLNQDVAFVNFRLLLLFYVVLFLSRSASLTIIGLNLLARLLIRGWTFGTISYLVITVILYLVISIVSIQIIRNESPIHMTILIHVGMTGVLWLFFHYIRWVNFGEVTSQQALYYWMSFVLMDLVLYYSITQMNVENNYLTTITRRATTDPLTGLKNFAQFENDLETQLEQYAKRPRPLTMIAMDIDHFKRINDEYGHLAGNAVLVSIGEILTDGVADVPGARVYRIGGEEFNILLPNTLIFEATEIAQRLKREIAQKTVTTNQQETIHFTASMGIALVNEQDSLRDFYERADQMLYHSKGEGRNTITTEEVLN